MAKEVEYARFWRLYNPDVITIGVGETTLMRIKDNHYSERTMKRLNDAMSWFFSSKYTTSYRMSFSFPKNRMLLDIYDSDGNAFVEYEFCGGKMILGETHTAYYERCLKREGIWNKSKHFIDGFTDTPKRLLLD